MRYGRRGADAQLEAGWAAPAPGASPTREVVAGLRARRSCPLHLLAGGGSGRAGSDGRAAPGGCGRPGSVLSRRSPWVGRAPPARSPCCPRCRSRSSAARTTSLPSPMPTQSAGDLLAEPERLRLATSPTSSASPTGTASAAGRVLARRGELARVPEPRWRPRRDRPGPGRRAHRVRPGGLAVPRQRAALATRCSTSTSRSPTAAATSSTVRGDAFLEVMISSVGIPPASAPRPGNASAASIAGTVVAEALPVYGGFEGHRPGLRRGARPQSGRSGSPCCANPTRLVVDICSG